MRLVLIVIAGWFLFVIGVLLLAVLLGFAGLFLEKFPAVKRFEVKVNIIKSNKNLKIFGVILIIVSVVWILTVGSLFNGSPSGQGTINVFPAGSDSKNYQLNADIVVTYHSKDVVWYSKSYEVVSADWPDGGTLYFKQHCVIYSLDSGANCTSDDGTKYYVEINGEPDTSSD